MDIACEFLSMWDVQGIYGKNVIDFDAKEEIKNFEE